MGLQVLSINFAQKYNILQAKHVGNLRYLKYFVIFVFEVGFIGLHVSFFLIL